VAVIVVVSACTLGAALIAGAVAWFLPNFDPAGPRAAATTIAEGAAKETEAHPRLAAYVRSRLDPGPLTGLALTIALALLLAGTVAIGALLVMVQHGTGLAHYDLSAARWGGSHATTGSTRVLRDISILGGTYCMIVVAVVAAFTQSLRTRTSAVVGFMALVVIGQTIVMNLTKYIVDRDRPDIHRLTGFSGSSFPSGHATTAAATFAAVALLVGRGRSRRVKSLLAAGAGGIAAAVAVSRILLGVHWFTDVLAGLAMGWAWFAISSIAFGGRVLRFGQPAEVAEDASAVASAASNDARV
jgi:undecaprenyl-diphosphatase